MMKNTLLKDSEGNIDTFKVSIAGDEIEKVLFEAKINYDHLEPFLKLTALSSSNLPPDDISEIESGKSDDLFKAISVEKFFLKIIKKAFFDLIELGIGRFHVQNEFQSDDGNIAVFLNSPKWKELLKFVIVPESDIRKLLEIPLPQRGGDRLSKFPWTQSDCDELRKVTTDLHPLWAHILEFFEHNEYNPQCFQWVKTDNEFKTLLKAIRLPSDVLLKSVEECRNRNGEKFRLLAFALQHAWQIIGNGKTYQYSTLKKKYNAGADRRKSRTRKKASS